MTDVTEAVAEVAEVVAEEATDVAEAARGLSSGQVKYLFAGLGIGLVVGSVIGYKVAERRLHDRFKEMAEEEIDEMRTHFRKRHAVQDKPALSELAAEHETIVRREGYEGPNVPTTKETQGETPLVPQEEPDREADERSAEVVVEETTVVEERNVWATQEENEHDASDGWDWEEEMRLRRPDRPYVIHYDEREEVPWGSVDFVYYAGDDVLVNELEEIIDPEKRDKIVGEDNLQKFGHGSPDLDAVHIRNDALEFQASIVKNDGKYAEIVHGFVQHGDDFLSGRNRGRRPRFDDD